MGDTAWFGLVGGTEAVYGFYHVLVLCHGFATVI
jgi:hypothetical protein